MSSSLDTLANDKLKKILYNLTSNKYLGVLIGTVITAIIHSSSATSVILISLLNSHLLLLIKLHGSFLEQILVLHLPGY